MPKKCKAKTNLKRDYPKNAISGSKYCANHKDKWEAKDAEKKKAKEQIKKEKWYLKKVFLGLTFPTILFFCGIIVAMFFFIISQASSEKTDILIESSKDSAIIGHNRIEDKIDSLLSSYPNNQEYLQNKQQFDTLIKKFDNIEKKLKDVQHNQKISQDSIQSLIREQKKLQQKVDAIQGFAKQISNFNYRKWPQIFPYGYAIFSIGINNKFDIFPGKIQKASIKWEDLNIKKITKDEIVIDLPALNFPNYITILPNTLAISIPRNYNILNRLYAYMKIEDPNVGLYTGILSDNENGIIGIIGMGDPTANYEGAPIIDRMALK